MGRNRVIYQFMPIFTVIITIAFGNPRVVEHIYNTFNNQDYTLNNTNHHEIDDLHHILSKINPGDTPVTYIEHGRYLNYLSKNQYINQNTNKIVKLSNKIWLPLRPAEIFVGLQLDRKITYIKRWLARHPTEKGWVISSTEEYWNQPIINGLKIALTNFEVNKQVEHGVLKAILYEQKK